MKNKYLKLLLLATITSFTACEGLLDLTPEDAVSKDAFFQTTNDFELAITGLYSELRPLDPDALGGAYAGNLYWEVCADAMFYKFSWTNPWYDISRGKLYPNTDRLDAIWGNLYQTINWANTIIEALDKNASLLSADFAKEVRGQAHFVRAICYIRLTSLWGAVPMISRVLAPADAKQPRTDVNELTTKLIIPDLEIAITNLNEKPYSGKWGRATKQAAMGMKVRALLYNKDYKSTVAAAQELMTLAAGSKYIDFLPEYEKIFANDNENNPEILFSLKYTAGGFKQGSTFNTPFGGKVPGLPTSSMNGSWESITLTPEYIDSYPMTDGLASTQSSVFDAQNPWKNRGPRFESTYYIAGISTVNGLPFEAKMVASISKDMIKDYPMNLDKGYMNESVKSDWTQEDESDFILLRYTDVLMMYAEAKTELNEIDNSVYDILDQVRDRAGIARVKRGQSQTEMRQTIQDERKWEFAYEGLRYFDIRRWGIAEKVINAIKSDEKYDFGSTKLFIAPNHYLWPLPQRAIDVNPNLLPNNPGY
ncbi:MAG: RagB/SusD family nutrient uptake outer membrane protein [Bacteroides sp.]|uniref:RagB/SusD family nutrient uptake outer membrane protein n=1 Tax=Bacteroides sp. TaxID=29523 RepID=UPI002FCADD23|nr:RagB/SusD family nutrient uptake outer membrane protein [Bacteroides sp.]